jgi:hypothetical protein
MVSVEERKEKGLTLSKTGFSGSLKLLIDTLFCPCQIFAKIV